MSDHQLAQGAPIVVIGAGQAGFAAANKLRDLGHTGPITLVGDEPVPPYQRPPLSKAYLLGEMTRERLFLRPPGYYADRDLTLRLECVATEIRLPEQKVLLSDGSTLPYERLLLATGARPRALPVSVTQGFSGLLAVRNLADADALGKAFLPGQRLLVVGGGYIGLEAAASAIKLGLKVTLIEATDRILQRVAAAETSDYFRQLHLSHGVDIREGADLSHLVGDGGRVTGAVLTSGERLPADLVVVGIGVLPNVELAAAAGITIANGIAVDEFCRTSAPGVFAAGDCTSFPFRERRIRLESVGNAIDQAEAAAANMVGQTRPYHAKPWFWSDQYDVKLQIAGLARHYDRVVLRPGSGAARSFWYFHRDQLEAVDAMNDPKAFMLARRLLESGAAINAEAVASPAADLRSFLSASH